VYAVGHAALTRDGRFMAATLACGPASALGKLAREDDAERQARLEAAGERVLRVTWWQAIAHPEQTLARLVAAGVPRA
jgi:hypothetical protein